MKREVVEKRLADLAVRVARLRTFQAMSAEELRKDWVKLGVVERLLQTAIQNVIDIGAHVLADLGDNAWDEYRDIPERLAAHGVLPAELVPSLRAMIGLRNILVHQYLDVDVEKISAVLRKNLDDFDRFAVAMVNYLKKAQT